VEEILGTGYVPSDVPGLGVLFEPADAAWSTNWHRDWAHAPFADFEAYRKTSTNMRVWNQLNAALYDDHSLWVVPGSHDRDDTPEERALFPDNPPAGPALSPEMSAVERETTCLAYARQMPNAVQIVLCAGDIAFYRNSSWHIGNYVPYVKRATLHDGFYCDEDRAWVAGAFAHRTAAKAAASASA
jgi:ectoine hydroxylase-related dioxygenase (phytanoyl-CoA dioxygenase family)